MHENVPPDTETMCHMAIIRRLRWLVASHLLLAVVPTAVCLVPGDIRFLPLLWALSSVALGQMMLLSFWAGLGAGRAIWRFFSALMGCTYLAIWQSLGSMLWDKVQGEAEAVTPTNPLTAFIDELLSAVVMNCAVLLLFAAMFLVVRRWFSELRLVPDAGKTSSPGRVQYSILNILVITAVVALLLGLTRSARPATGTDWQKVAAYALAFVAFLIDELCAVWAALGTGRIRWRVFLVFLVASLLGLLLSITAGHGALAWWLVPSWILVSLVPIAIVVTSLLVVRACGYRLVPKSSVATVNGGTR